MSSFEQPNPHKSSLIQKNGQPLTPCFRLAKSPLHRKLQLFLRKNYPGEDLCMEKKFPSIKRIADLVLMQQKKVLEVQTSLISIKELLERERDYNSLGFEVIWILYDKIFDCEPPLLVTRFFYAKNTFFFSFHEEKLFVFRNLDRVIVPVKTFFKPNPLHKKCFRIFCDLFFKARALIEKICENKHTAK